MSARPATAAQAAQKAQRELEDLQLVLRARNGHTASMDALMKRYTGFVRLKASSYFLAGGDAEDLIQEGLIGLYKAVRDFNPKMETSFRSFAELCVTRQIITAIKTATRFKHAPLNTYVSFSHTPAGQDGDGRDRHLDRRAPVARLHARHGSLAPRVGRPAALPRRHVLRGDGGRARLRLQDDRQRTAAREAEDRPASADARSPGLGRGYHPAVGRSSSAGRATLL
jgi:RNA polymerase sigma factor (sigma-70 family)